MGFFFQGLTLGLAYVAPIGMQNLFVIDSALTKPRRRALLTHFRSVEALRAASLEEIAAVPGMNRPAAENVWNFLHPGD